jgi:hypothetical protein
LDANQYSSYNYFTKRELFIPMLYPFIVWADFKYSILIPKLQAILKSQSLIEQREGSSVILDLKVAIFD